MFDLTKKVILENNWQERYRKLQILLLVHFIVIGIYLAYRTLFPIQSFFINLGDLKAKENTLGYGKTAISENIISAYSSENFSEATIQITAGHGETANLSDTPIEIRKTYQTLSYSLSDKAVAFPNGSLVQSDQKFYLVSEGKLRRFSSSQVFRNLGYTEKNFLGATLEEISFSPVGEEIFESQNFPENSLFLIDKTYYELRGQVLFPFVSENAFLSRFDKNQALEKSADFLTKFAVDEDAAIGFASGSLLSFDNGIFIVDNETLMPFPDPVTFLASGYDWGNVVPVSEGETSVYPRENVFSIARPHPDGTIYFTQDTNKYYLVNRGQRQEIRGAAILQSYLKQGAIQTLEQSLDFQNGCHLKKVFWPLRSYQCNIAIKGLWQFPGKDYQFKLVENNSAKISSVEINFFRNINRENMRTVLADIKMRLMRNYGYENIN